ncbi:MAG: hypothetical protein KatS3mg026_0157 [Bacteroidia bacterium]|nr:MAG: hypothetical protein KatS3mg026_0157 [Bacteroidia bacterium]
MKRATFWAAAVALLGSLCALSLFLPQFRIQVWDTSQSGYLYFWGGHEKFRATVSGWVYGIAALWAIAGVGGLMRAAWLLKKGQRAAIAWLNWAAFFLAMQLTFLLVAAEEVLTDLRVASLHADSFAQVGSWTPFVVFLALLFLPGRVKKALFSTPKSA